MADWGNGARSEKSRLPQRQPSVKLYGPYDCIKCSQSYMSDKVHIDGFVCKKCQQKQPVHIPSPPPMPVQLALEDVFRTKK